MIECIKLYQAFTPIADHMNKMDKLVDGETYILEAVKKTTWQFHKLVFATINMYFQQQQQFNFASLEECKEYLKLKLGYGKWLVVQEQTIFKTDSLDMQQSMKKKQAFYESLVPFVADALGVSEHQIKNNWKEYL